MTTANTVVRLVDAGERASAASWVAQFRASRGLPPGDLIVLPANYSFPQLKEWRDRLVLFASSREDVFTLDIDERIAQVRIGVEGPLAREETLRQLQTLQIPSDAVEVVFASKPESRQDLQDHVRPVQADFQIQGLAPNPPCPTPGGCICTLGFNTRVSNVRSFVTASHCSDEEFYLDGGTQTQPVSTDTTRVGSEDVDPAPYYIDPECQYCRWSDASLYRYFPDVDDRFGYLARTTAFGVGAAGSLTIDPEIPEFEITAKHWDAPEVVGEVINKVGRTSGWTRGRVVETCVLIEKQNADMWCQNVAALWSEGGDSGSPMFYAGGTLKTHSYHPWESTDAGALGILWGGPFGVYDTTYYSPLMGVDQDLGIVDVCPSPPCLVQPK